MEKSKNIESPIGNILIKSYDSMLVSLNFGAMDSDITAISEGILSIAANQLNQYFEGSRKIFELDLSPHGTEFQHKVWEIVKDIPFGSTMSYLEVAKKLGSPTYTRAVGLANSKNPIPIIIPCHRVIGANGKLTGYAGGIERKKWLLLHEQKFSSQNRLF